MRTNFTDRIFTVRCILMKNVIKTFCISLLSVILAYTNVQAQLNYTFSQTQGTYTPITGGSVVYSGVFDDGVIGPITVPIVQFNGVAYNQMYINANGYLTFGSTAPSGTLYTPISSTTAYNAALSPFGRDLENAASGSPEVRWEVIGGNLVVQWQDVKRFGATAAGERLSFQARVNLASGDISFVYGGVITPGANTTYPQIGLRGATNTLFSNRSVADSTGNWINSLDGATNASTCYYNSANPLTVPTAGLTYTWTNTSPVVTPQVKLSEVAGGNWDSPSTWVGGVVPGLLDTVVIVDGSTVTINISPVVAELRVGQGTSGILNFNATAARNLFVNGNVTVNSGGSITSVPTTGTSVRQITLVGNFINNGTCDLSQPNFAMTFSGTSAQTFGGSGTLANGNGVGQMQINNPAGVTLNVPVRLAFNLDLVNGNFNVGNNLTFNYQIAPTATAHTIRRSPLSQIIGTPTFVSDTVNLSYVVFTGQTSALITTGVEVPSSRNIHQLTISNVAGLQLAGGDLTIRAASSAITLTSGVINVPSANKLIFTNPSYTSFAAGSNASHINGQVQFRVNSTAAQTRTIPIGNGTFRRQVGLGGLNTGGSNLDITVSLESGVPSGNGNAPISLPLGNRLFRISSVDPLPSTATVTLNWGAEDNLNIGNPSQIRVVQGASASGPWDERSVSSALGSFTGTGSRTTTAGIDLANGEFFTWGTAASFDLSAFKLISPFNLGCKDSAETLIVSIRNSGIPISYATNNATIGAIVTLPNNTTLPPITTTLTSGTLGIGASQNLLLGNIDMRDTGTYSITLYAQLAGDLITSNDSITAFVVSTPYLVSADPVTIPSNGNSQLNVQNPRIPNFTPVSAKGLRLTEITMFRTGTGSTLSYPSYFPSNDDMMEFTNITTSPVDVSGDSLIILGTGAVTFVFPQNTIVPAGGVIMVFLGTGVTDTVNGLYFTGSGSWSSGSNTGIILKSGSTVYDAVAFNAFQFPAGVIPANMWTTGGALSLSGRAGSSLLGLDRNDSLSWTTSNTPSPRQTQGTFNPGLFDAGAINISWSGPSGFSASGQSVNTGNISQSGVRTYNATITESGCPTKNASVDITVLPPVAPIVGFTASSLTATTGGTVTTVTFTDTSSNFPSTWKWSFNPSSVTYVGGTSDSSQNPQVQFNAEGDYDVSLVVSNVSGSDSVLKVDYITVTKVFCAINATNSADSDIGLVSFGSLNNGSATPILSNPAATGGYRNFDTLPSVNFSQGAFYPITVSQITSGGTFYSAFINVFIDFNQNGAYDLPSERVFAAGPTGPDGSTSPTTTQFSGNVLIPGSALLGNTRMRVILRETFANGTISIDPCETFTYGEIEDYQINIVANPLSNVNLISPPNNISLPVSCGNNTPVNISWTSSGISGTTYSWVASPTGNFLSPLISIPSNNNGADTILTLTSGGIDALLSSLSVGLGDSVTLQWAVKVVTAVDSFITAPRVITLVRSASGVQLPSFTLLGPANNTTVNLNTIPYADYASTPISANWNRVSSACVSNVSYQWQVTTATGSFAPALVNLPSNNNGADTVITLSALALDQTLNALGIPYGSTANLRWRVRAFSGSVESFSDTFLINVTRRTIICSTVAAPVVNPNPANLCGPGSVTLTASGAAGVNQLWTNLLGQPLGRNSSLTVNATASTSVRARNFSIDTGYARLGPDAQLNNNPFAAANFTNGHFITATVPVYWNTVVMRTTGAVSGFILLRDTSQGSAPFTGRTLDSAFFSLPAAGTFTVPVGMVIPNGNFFVNVTVTAGTGILYRTTGGAVFPYTVPGVLSITGTDFATQNRFYYLFDWNITPICASPVTLVSINLNSAPATDFTFSITSSTGVVNFTSFVGTVDSVRWNFGDGNTSTMLNPMNTYTATNTYNVTLTAYRNGCDSVVTKQVSVVLGVNDPQLEQSLQVFPNPSTGVFNLKFDNALPNAAISITDLTGKVVMEKNLHGDGGMVDTTIDLTSFAQGMYFARIINGDAVQTIKLKKD